MEALFNALSAEVLKTWGPFAFLLMGLALAVWRCETRCKARDEEIAALRLEIADLQEKRLTEAREMIRVTETSTTIMHARVQGDERFQDLLRTLIDRIMAIGPDRSRPGPPVSP